jgi:hypothetical protein
MAELKDPWDQADTGLGAVEKLIKLLKPLIGIAIPDFHAASHGFETVCKKLLDANENLTRWITRFRDFDFTQPEAGKKLLELAGEYRALKTGRRYQELKFDCGEIEMIFFTQIRGKLKDIFAGDKLNEAQAIFEQLSVADAGLVNFVHTVIFENLDTICEASEAAVNKGDFDAAEEARLQFKVRSGVMFRRLEVIASELSELVLDFKRLASGAHV